MIPMRFLTSLHFTSLSILYLLSGASATPEQNHDCQNQVDQPLDAIDTTEGGAADTPSLLSASTQGHDNSGSIATASHSGVQGNDSERARPDAGIGARIVANEGRLYPQPNIPPPPPEDQRTIPELMRAAYDLGMFDSITNEDALRMMGLPGVRRSEQAQGSNDARNISNANNDPEHPTDAGQADNGSEGNSSSERQPQTSSATSSPASIAATLLPTADEGNLASIMQDNPFPNNRPYISFQVSF